MSFPKQSSVVERLEKETNKSMRRIEDKASAEIQKLWDAAKRETSDAIASEYRNDFPNETWSLAEAEKRGTLGRIAKRVNHILRIFLTDSLATVSKKLDVAHREQMLRSAWTLDQTTPLDIEIKISGKMREAYMVSHLVGRAAATKWYERWAGWVNAYDSALYQNLRLNSINGGSLSDAADEPEATRPGSPSYSLNDVFDRIFRTEFVGTMNQAIEDVLDANKDVVITEIWQTREDSKVCPICEPNYGKESSEVKDSIPAHPGCRCFYRLVPKEWQKLLREPNPRLAKRMQDQGLVPDAMVVTDETGRIVGATIVEFERWRPGKERMIS